MKRLLPTLFLILSGLSINAQEINNLIHAPDYAVSEWGELGEVKEFGSGDEVMILLPGWGFDWQIFRPLISKYESRYKIYAVTFPGFGATNAPKMPEEGGYSDLYWTKGILKGIEDLIETRGIENATLVSYFTYSNIIATRLALDIPEKIEQVIIISGMAKYTSNIISHEPANLNQRIYYTEKILADRWFKTVNKATWDSGNFQPEIFTKDSVSAGKYRDRMSAVPIPVMVRYLCEYYCTDLSLEYKNLKIPVLVVVPGFTDNVLYSKETSYVDSFFHYSWLGAKAETPNITIVTITDSNAFIADDQPDKLFQLMDEFLDKEINRYKVVR